MGKKMVHPERKSSEKRMLLFYILNTKNKTQYNSQHFHSQTLDKYRKYPVKSERFFVFFFAFQL
ncbi:MAG: hypothetical protein PHG41_00885 [Actinomycetota bacterium]|nr:hypothetical protein [Actinomycetota bacterium]